MTEGPDDFDKIDRLIAVIADQGRSVRGLESLMNQLLPILAKQSSGSSTNKTTVTQTDKTPMWVCVVIVVALATALVSQRGGDRAELTRVQGQLNDMRADVRELRSVDQELRSTDNAVRAYINTGILKPKTEAAKTGTGK